MRLDEVVSVPVINLTRDRVTVLDANGITTLLDMPPTAAPAHVQVRREQTPHYVQWLHAGAQRVPVYAVRRYGVTGVPDPSAGVCYVVTRDVKDHLPARHDLLVPGEAVYDANGLRIGHRGLDL